MSGKPGSLFKYGFSNPKAGAPLASSVAGPSSATQAEVSAEQSASLQVSSSPKRPAEQSQRPEATVSLDQLPASREGEASSGPVNEQPAAKRPKHKPVVEDTEAKWLYGYHWARRSGTDKKGHAIMCCQICSKHQPSSQWASQGVTVHDESILKRHEGSKSHGRAVDKEAGRFGLAKAVENVSNVSNAEDACPEVGDDFASELGY